MRSFIAAATAGNFQAAWYFSLLIFASGGLILAGFILTQLVLRPMWRAGDRALAVLVGAVASVTTLFFALLLVTVSIGLLRRAFGA